MEISVIIPLFNESESIPELHSLLSGVLSGLGRDYEIIFVDDGSTDDSIGALKSAREKDARVRVIQFRRNYGKSAALSAGFKYAGGDIVITMDADLQDIPGEIPKFVEKLNEGFDLVSGWRQDRKDSLFKRAVSVIYNRLTSLITGIRIHDFNCGFKAFRKELTREIRVYGELHRYLPVLARWKGFRVGEVRIAHSARKYGKSKYGIGSIPRGCFDLFTVLLLTRYTKKPLRLFGKIGLLSLFAGITVLFYLAVTWFHGRGIGHRPLLQLGVLLLIFGIQMFSIGFLGEMILNGPAGEDYSVKQKID